MYSSESGGESEGESEGECGTWGESVDKTGDESGGEFDGGAGIAFPWQRKMINCVTLCCIDTHGKRSPFSQVHEG